MNFRIHVIKDNVLSRSLPDCSVIMLEHMVNENNYHILSYISDSEDYWQTMYVDCVVDMVVRCEEGSWQLMKRCATVRCAARN